MLYFFIKFSYHILYNKCNIKAYDLLNFDTSMDLGSLKHILRNRNIDTILTNGFWCESNDKREKKKGGKFLVLYDIISPKFIVWSNVHPAV